MLFKNLNIYRMGQEISEEALTAMLDANPFSPCLPSQERSAGFTQVVGLDSRLFSVGAVHLFCLMTEEKKVPTGAIKTALNKEVQAKEKSEGRRLKRDEKRAIQDEIKARLLVNFPPQAKETWAYVDNKAKILVINSSSRKVGDAIATILRGAMESPILFPVKPQYEVAAKMTFWVAEEQTPEPFTLGEKCTIGEEEGTIRYKDRSLEDPNLQNYLQNNLQVAELALVMGDRSSFMLTDDFMIKGFSLSEIALGDLDAGAGEPLELLQADLTLMSAEVNAALKNLLMVLGGEAQGEGELQNSETDSIPDVSY